MDYKINWEALRKDRIRRQLEKAANGFEDVECEYCNGTGVKREGFTDYDAHGSFWVETEHCRHCVFGQVEVPIELERRKLALKQLLKELDND